MTTHHLEIPEAALGQHTAVLGKTGSGKTSTSKLLVEHVVREKDARVCVLDPIKSDWWGLTLDRDGKRKGLPFQILGGPYGHVPLHAGAGEAIGRIVASGALRHSIIDMADFDAGDYAKFFVPFARALFRNLTGVLYLVVEEAHIFAPKERAGFGEEAKSTHWLNKLATGGRSKGIRLMVCTQRTQALHNAVLGSCETAIIHRLTLPADQEPARKWLLGNTDKKSADEIASAMSSLKTGEGWVCSGELNFVKRIHFPRISTYDNSATPTGNEPTKHVTPPAVDAEALKAIIGNAVEEAKANDPVHLKRTIAEQARRIAEMERKTVAPAVERVEVPILTATDFRNLQGIMGQVQETLKGVDRTIKDALDPIAAKATISVTVLGQPEKYPALDNRLVDRSTKRIIATLGLQSRLQSDRSTPARAVVASPAADGTTGGLRRMLIALAQRPQGMSAKALGVRANLSSTSGTFNTYLSRGKVEGWLDGDRNRLMITDAGRASLGENWAPLPKGAALLQKWLDELGGGAARMLQALAGRYPEGFTREELGQASGLSASSGTFNTYLSRLRTLELVTTHAGGVIAAAGELFD